ncbi:MAG: hypothetical protein QXW10_04205 [Candidatus Micrarchaeaceae archaeon]
MLIAVAIMLPFVFLFAYSFSNGSGSVHAYATGMLDSLTLNAKLQEVLALDWTGPNALEAMLENATNIDYSVVKAPAQVPEIMPANAVRLAVVNGDVYYIESGGNESADFN